MLCVQRTGWGKSAVYFIAAALLRERGAGPALIVSPLLALMRNQIAAAERLGIRAHTINSTNREAWDEVRALLEADAVDLLLISPERLDNPQFRAELPAAVRRARRPAGDRRGALHQRLGARLPARLPAARGDARAAARRRRGAVHDRDRQRPRGGRRRGAAARPPACAPTAGRWAARACGSRWWSCPARPTGSPGWRPTCRSSRARASSTRSPSATPSWSPTGSPGAGSPPRPTAARSRASGGSRSRSGCWPTTSRPWWPPARSGWATTSPTSGSSSTTRRPAR